jgi:hypothetical protein
VKCCLINRESYQHVLWPPRFCDKIRDSDRLIRIDPGALRQYYTCCVHVDDSQDESTTTRSTNSWPVWCSIGRMSGPVRADLGLDKRPPAADGVSLVIHEVLRRCPCRSTALSHSVAAAAPLSAGNHARMEAKRGKTGTARQGGPQEPRLSRIGWHQCLKSRPRPTRLYPSPLPLQTFPTIPHTSAGNPARPSSTLSPVTTRIDRSFTQNAQRWEW